MAPGSERVGMGLDAIRFRGYRRTDVVCLWSLPDVAPSSVKADEHVFNPLRDTK